MLLRLNESPRIEDLRNHSAECVETLRTLLRTGAPARSDPRRQSFYEIDNCSRVFYIHITPRGKVWLLAIWTKDSAQAGVESETGAAYLDRPLQSEHASPGPVSNQTLSRRAHHVGG